MSLPLPPPLFLLFFHPARQQKKDTATLLFSSFFPFPLGISFNIGQIEGKNVLSSLFPKSREIDGLDIEILPFPLLCGPIIAAMEKKFSGIPLFFLCIKEAGMFHFPLSFFLPIVVFTTDQNGKRYSRLLLFPPLPIASSPSSSLPARKSLPVSPFFFPRDKIFVTDLLCFLFRTQRDECLRRGYMKSSLLQGT